MLISKRPTKEQIRRFLTVQKDRSFSYAQVGATRGKLPPGYVVDHNRVRLGEGPEAYARAVRGVRRWEMFHLGWVELCWPDTPLLVGATVGILSHQWGFWTLNASRIVYLIEEEGSVCRFGFAYGTLAEHVERGEERFTVEWRRDDASVWYDLLAISRPNSFLVKLAYPLTRMLQKRFAADSKRAMFQSVNTPQKTCPND